MPPGEEALVPLPQSLGQFNKRFTNRVTRPFAARLPGFGVVIHTGRRTGRTYSVPVVVFRRREGYEFALTYGRGDWVKNVLHEGRAQLQTRGRRHELTNPRVVSDPHHHGIARPVRRVLRTIHADEVLFADDAGIVDDP
jgi:deazaflavin-dependent oxidoreductase (nitroreductase family)